MMTPARIKKNPVSKIFVPNRGEIAVRVIRACRELDIPVVVGFSEADAESLHVQLADEAVCLGPAAPLESYLNIQVIVEAAKRTGCDAVHPGYGFLAENARFAEALEGAAITFIAPPASVIHAMGSKIESRRLMEKAGVPIVPGTVNGSEDVDTIVAEAKKIKGQIFLKASAGGGGKGMRLVTDRSKLPSLVKEAVGEARSAFGDGTVYVEKRIDKPRHIEFQILADHHGNVVHLFERECSIQRRHQKLLEEAPSIALDKTLRDEMGQAAVKAAKAVGYRNAGTIEFMLDAGNNFYFLEMNTRIQVEHPITEYTTGLDLVKWQILIARGERLPFEQKDILSRGHAIECRIYAEDPRNHFLPSCGVIDYLREPWGPGIRNDSGVYQGWEVGPHYDPILSKLVTYAEDRDAARRKMLEALDEYIVHGIHTTIEVHKKILTSKPFVEGKTNTDFLDTHLDDWFEDTGDVPDEAFIAAALAEALMRDGTRSSGSQAPAPTPWQLVGEWEIGGGA
jgi:acetyl-CoA carboxylase biotin carboxylase subunit